MSKIYESLYLGNYEVSQNPVFFEKNQIQNILIVASDLKISFKKKNYFQINVIDNEDELIIKHWPSCVQFIQESQGNTLVHCLAGMSRSASTVMAYAMFKENLTSEKSMKKISKLHIDSNPNTGFLKQLEFWDEILFAYRQQVAFGQKENFGLLQMITNKFLDNLQNQPKNL
ncbi:dual specificity phosphatase domain protein (macronuclear) [Tetrahymena thermophila SB210]|uniref:protein-tyrosine-phosphatase n=1 Tax=Tetrahymena thermophila (strain SB210) TaxID=312017 RepID=Q23FG6_TETTS|nr:dual specificity phosphatase domain protein [Tetrahymena thermophila SB210]EAR95187.1 dual specificity phosphatase domain protein [Tetrahymena thermophila SB210]|eukprot:XP_001015432.1 dual specificity phosphatase domain protein [Tetrahymena thermophila SB210]